MVREVNVWSFRTFSTRFCETPRAVQNLFLSRLHARLWKPAEQFVFFARDCEDGRRVRSKLPTLHRAGLPCSVGALKVSKERPLH